MTSQADLLLDVVRSAQRLLIACDALSEDVAGTYIGMAIDVLRSSPRLDDASVFGEAGAHPLDPQGAQPDM